MQNAGMLLTVLLMSLFPEYYLLAVFTESGLHWYSGNEKNKKEFLCKKDITNLIAAHVHMFKACAEFQMSRTGNTIPRIEQALA